MQRKDAPFALLYVIILLFAPINVNAQVNANFSSVQTIGCSPLMVEFNDLSTGSNIIYRKWEFGNGNMSIGNNTHPYVIYNSSGFYSVTLTVSDGIDTSTVTKTNLIHVTPPPTAAISLPVNHGCVPVTLSPQDISTASVAPIVSWEWDFDDGALLDSNQNAVHTYQVKGNYSISLKVTDSLGCSDYTIISHPFKVYKPKSRFSSIGSRFACSPPLNVNLSSQPIGTSPFTYSWTVNNQNFTSSQLATAIHQSGNYDVELIVTDSIGCKDTLNINNYLRIGNSSTSINAPDTTCRNTLENFIAVGPTNSYYTWDYGDGNTGTGISTSHSYAYPGTFTITLVANNPGGCSDTVTQNIVVETVSADFTSSPHYSCQQPMMVNFQDQSTGNITQWEWNFGAHNGTSTSQNPTHQINHPGIYNDTLTVTTAFGCQSTVVKLANDSLIVNQANFTPSITEGCAPLTVQFQNTTPALLSLQSVFWDFDFGSVSSTTNTQMSPTHVFTIPGVYKVKLTAITYSGCQTSIIKTIRVGSPQNAAFALDTNLACGSESIQCINNSTDTNLINYYSWNFGDGSFEYQPQPQHIFKDTGYLNISLIVGYNGCYDTASIDSAIYIKSPITDFSYNVDCTQPNNVAFSPSTLGGTSFYWDFDDNSPIDSTSWNHTHVFPNIDGDYDVSILAKDSTTSCQYKYTKKVRIRYLQGQLSSTDSITCLNDSVLFSTSGSNNIFGSIDWSLNNFSNLASGIGAHKFRINQRGNNTIYAIIKDLNGCRDTLATHVKAFKPIARMNVDTMLGCAPFSVQFSDSSSSDTNIISYLWNFGDGTNSSQKNFNHVYTQQQATSYDVSLTVTDTFGCSHSVKRYDYIATTLPPAFFNSTDLDICARDTANFIDIPNGNYTYAWDFGDSSSSTIQTPSHAYQTDGQYSISLSVADSNGCINTFTRPSFITVRPIPSPQFASDKQSTSCYPSSIIFNNTSNIATSWEWNFGDTTGTRITSSGMAQHLYHQPGVYDITLKVTSDYGCSDSINLGQHINIQGPTAQIDLQPNTGCLNKQFSFNVAQINPAANIFTWDFGDGTIQTLNNQSSAIYHTYNYATSYDITLLTSDSLGLCVKTDQSTVHVIEIKADFDLSHQFGCTPVNLNLTNKSAGYNQQAWSVDGIFKSSSKNPNLDLTQPGMRTISLKVWNDSVSCMDSIQKQIEVFPLPHVSTYSDTSICYGDSLQLSVSGANSFQWFPSNFLTATNIPNPITTTTQNMQYVVQGTDSNNCINTDTLDIQIVTPAQILSFPKDTMIYEGQSFALTVNADQKLNYLWTSDEYLSCEDCKDPFVEPQQKSVYTLHYEDPFQCFSGDTSVTVDIIDFNVYIPNSFTPNNDGDNDVFMLASDGVDRLMYMYIYDYWGNLVYESRELDQGWDGTYNGQTLNGNTAYVYKIKVIGFSGKTAEFVGTVNLISR
ncbi:PKD domain-containing protein [bacterium SCSIO 12643]|nr:PKD domain-containing protein [bacterium SCSIO 12643]